MAIVRWAESFVFMVFDFVFGASVHWLRFRCKRADRSRAITSASKPKTAPARCAHCESDPCANLITCTSETCREIAAGHYANAFFFFGVFRKKGSNYKRTTEEQMEKLREIAGRGQPEKYGLRCHVAAENKQTKSSSSGKPPRGSIATVSRLAPLCQGNDGQQTSRWRCADPCSVMAGRPPVLEANAKGCGSVREHGRWHHVSDRCTCKSGASHGRGARSWKLFVSANVGAILWKANRAQGSPSEESEGKLLDTRRVVNSSVATPSWHAHVW